MALLRDLRGVDGPTIRAALNAGGAVRRFIDAEGENNLWIVYESDQPAAVAVAAVNSDRMVRLLVNISGTVILLDGESIITKRDVAGTVDGTVDRQQIKLQTRLDRSTVKTAEDQAALDAYNAP